MLWRTHRECQQNFRFKAEAVQEMEWKCQESVCIEYTFKPNFHWKKQLTNHWFEKINNEGKVTEHSVCCFQWRFNIFTLYFADIWVPCLQLFPSNLVAPELLLYGLL